MVPFLVTSIVFVVKYAEKVRRNPEKSLVYGIDLGTDAFKTDAVPDFEKQHIPVAVVVRRVHRLYDLCGDFPGTFL